MKKGSVYFFLLILILSQLCSCDTKHAPIVWSFGKEEITGKKSSPSNKLNVDIYIDATTSMMGFTSPNPTNYSRLIDDVESTVKNTWRETDLKFLKFTTKIDTITREDFITSKNSSKFYVDRKTRDQLNIDNAVANVDPKRVSIIITDLFYKNQDLNKVVNTLNENCIKRGIDIGVLSVTSEFTGTVADVEPAVDITAENRPLYVLVFGDKGNIQKVFDAFNNKSYVNAAQKFLVSKHPVESYDIIVEKKKDKNNSAINSDQGNVSKYKDFGDVFGFKLKEKGKDAFLTFELTVDAHPAFANYSSSNIKLTAFKKISEVKDSVPTDEISLSDVKVNGNKITGELKLSTKEKEEEFSYLVNVGFDNTTDLQMPKWIQKYNTETYTKEGPKETTIYLSKLFTQVTTFNNTINNPQLGKFYIYIRQ